MNCCGNSKSATIADKINKMVENRIKLEKKNQIKEFKLLLLGTGESGKSTFVKQMRYIHGSGYTENEKLAFIPIIIENIIICAKKIVQMLGAFGYVKISAQESFDSYDETKTKLLMERNRIKNHSRIGNQKGISTSGYVTGTESNKIDSDSTHNDTKDTSEQRGFSNFKSLVLKDDNELDNIIDDNLIKSALQISQIDPTQKYDSAIILESLRNLKRDMVKNILSIGSKYSLPDSADYFLDPKNYERILSEGYVPTFDDIVRVRQATTGILEFVFEIKKIFFRIIDVGGQRSERRKWIHCFENVTSIIFLASTTEYDQNLAESKETNRLRESLALFKTIISYQYFTESSIILFLNKIDLLEKKIKISNIADNFPEFMGKPGDFNDAKTFLLEKYNGCNEGDTKRTIYVHYTCATDTENIRFVFEAIKDTILQRHLKEYNLV